MTARIQKSMGRGPNEDIRNLIDPTRPQREAAKYEAGEELRKQLYTYCREILNKRDENDFSACIKQYNENYLNAMDDLVRPRCIAYATAALGLSHPLRRPELGNISDPESVRQFQIARKAYQEFGAKFDACNNKYNPMEMVRQKGGKFLRAQEKAKAAHSLPPSFVKNIRTELFQYCQYKVVDEVDRTHNNNASSNACMKSFDIEMLVRKRRAAQLKCGKDTRRQYGVAEYQPGVK